MVVQLILGHHTFSLAGHDRGSYVAFRLAMDHPGAVEKLAVIDSIPIIDHLERMDWRFARDWYHWFFFSQKLKPEAAINADPLGWYDAIKPGLMGKEAYDDVVSALTDPVVIHGMVEDYRAGLAVDWKHDVEDRKHGRKIQCPLLRLWSRFDDLVDHFGDPLPIWRSWASDVQGHPLDSGHHIAEVRVSSAISMLRPSTDRPFLICAASSSRAAPFASEIALVRSKRRVPSGSSISSSPSRMLKKNRLMVLPSWQ